MTIQAPEVLLVDPGSIELPAMRLYSILVGNIDDPKTIRSYNFKTKGAEAKIRVSTALWRGYISTYRLRADGTLMLERLEYPFATRATSDEVHEVLEGDFWLDLRETFVGEGVKVPFSQGKIVGDRTRWKLKEGRKATR
jgi:hypothetical protein